MQESRVEKALLSFLEPGSDKLEAALAYAANRFFVIPLQERSKRPVFADWQNKATTDQSLIKHWWGEGHEERNIGIVLKLSCLLVLDVDPRHGGDQTLAGLIEEFGPPPRTYTINTGGGGRHYVYRLPADYDGVLQQYPCGKDSGFEVRTFGQIVAPPSRTSEYYTVRSGSPHELTLAPLHWLDQIGGRFDSQRSHFEFDEVILKGARNETCAQLAGLLRRHGATEDQIVAMIDGFGNEGFIEDYGEFADEVQTIARSIARHPPEGIHFRDLKFNLVSRKSPKPELDDAALQGVLGDWVKFILPHTEAHPAALLSQALVACGNAMGSRPSFLAEGTRHRMSLYCVIVGASSRGAKGSSWSRVRELVESIDEEWSYDMQGLSSGEGLIERLADDLELEDSAIINGEKVQFTVKGVEDKRLLIVEQEFARPLHAAQRIGNTLSDVLRELFDEGSTGKLTVSAKKVSDALFSLIGHTTQIELNQLFNPIDMMNGFGNRIMWVHSEQTKLLPNSRPMTEDELDPFKCRLEDAFQFARDEAPRVYPWTKQSRQMWEDIYYELMKDKYTDLVDAITKRGRAIMRRMSLIYAVLDCSPVIRTEHLGAAFAMWKYCEHSAMYLFSKHLGDPTADRVYRALLEHPAGLTHTELHRSLHNNATAGQIKVALSTLEDRNLIYLTRMKRGKRTTEVILARQV